MDTFWTFDFEEYKIWQDSEFTKESVWKKMHEQNPTLGEALLKENNRHFILMHNFDETEEVFPEYYKVPVEHLLENGLVFDEPKFLLT
ncbi:MAG: hypothetical protein Q4G00_07545 [Clostridia bacterium]|nr:hypothetical protein [Clostridia bacterium]